MWMWRGEVGNRCERIVLLEERWVERHIEMQFDLGVEKLVAVRIVVEKL